MKNIFLVIAFLSLTLSSNAQSEKFQKKISDRTEYVSEAMNMSDTNKAFLYKSYLENNYEANQKKKGLGTEEKKEIVKEYKEKFEKTLSVKFSQKEIKQIFTLLKEKMKLNKQAQMAK